MNTKYKVQCPLDPTDEVFIVDEAGLYEMGDQPTCHCGMIYIIEVIANG